MRMKIIKYKNKEFWLGKWRFLELYVLYVMDFWYVDCFFVFGEIENLFFYKKFIDFLFFFDYKIDGLCIC